MNDTDPSVVQLDITDLQSFAAQLRFDIEHVLQPAHASVTDEFWATLGGDRPNQALGNHALNPTAQWIGAGIEMNLRGVAEHLGALIDSFRFMAELAEAIAVDHRTIDEQNAMDVTRLGEFATTARGAVERHHAEQRAILESAADGNEQS